MTIGVETPGIEFAPKLEGLLGVIGTRMEILTFMLAIGNDLLQAIDRILKDEGDLCVGFTLGFFLDQHTATCVLAEHGNNTVFYPRLFNNRGHFVGDVLEMDAVGRIYRDCLMKHWHGSSLLYAVVRSRYARLIASIMRDSISLGSSARMIALVEPVPSAPDRMT